MREYSRFGSSPPGELEPSAAASAPARRRSFAPPGWGVAWPEPGCLDRDGAGVSDEPDSPFPEAPSGFSPVSLSEDAFGGCCFLEAALGSRWDREPWPGSFFPAFPVGRSAISPSPPFLPASPLPGPSALLAPWSEAVLDPAPPVPCWSAFCPPPPPTPPDRSPFSSPSESQSESLSDSSDHKETPQYGREVKTSACVFVSM
ncbi:MAG: hypothetical protein N2C14_23430 [Planctomycetales bacterium]